MKRQLYLFNSTEFMNKGQMKPYEEFCGAYSLGLMFFVVWRVVELAGSTGLCKEGKRVAKRMECQHKQSEVKQCLRSNYFKGLNQFSQLVEMC